MSKEEYANEIKKLAYHYNKGKQDERERILKVIDDYIVDLKDGKEWGAAIPVITLEALKEILRR